MSKPFNFNRKNISSLNESFQQVLNERMTAQRALSIQRNAEKNARKAEKRELQTRLDQEIRNLSTNPPQGLDASDQNALRAAAINKLQQDKDFVKRANAIGLTVGQHTGGGSAGSFGYRHSTDAEAIDARNRSREQLFNKDGTPKLPDFENKTWNDTEGKFDVPMVGSDDPRYKELQKQQQERQAARDASAREEELNRPESAATQYGRMAQRMGAGALRPPRSQYEAEQQAAARADLEKAYDEARSQGRRLGYEDESTLRAGFARRGYRPGQPMSEYEITQPANAAYNAALENKKRVEAEVAKNKAQRDAARQQHEADKSAILDDEMKKVDTELKASLDQKRKEELENLKGRIGGGPNPMNQVRLPPLSSARRLEPRSLFRMA